MTSQPNKHYRIVLWTILYRHPVIELIVPRREEAVDRWACERCKLDFDTFLYWKALWPRHYSRMLHKRSLRREFFLVNGYVYAGRTPPDRQNSDLRQNNLPIYANFLRNEGGRTRRFFARVALT